MMGKNLFAVVHASCKSPVKPLTIKTFKNLFQEMCSSVLFKIFNKFSGA